MERRCVHCLGSRIRGVLGKPHYPVYRLSCAIERQVAIPYVRNCPFCLALYSSSGLLRIMTETSPTLGADAWDLDRLPDETVGILETRRRPPLHRSETRSSRSRFPKPGLRRIVDFPEPVSRLPWSVDFSALDSDGRTVGAWIRSPGGCGSPPDRADAVSMWPSWTGCWPWNGSRIVSWRSPSWVSRSRMPGRSVGRCTVRSLGVGGSRPPGIRGGLSKLRRSVGSWRVGSDRPNSRWRWKVGPSSASPDSRPPVAWMSWSGPGWSLCLYDRDDPTR